MKRSKPSPALLVAIVALVAALGGGAVAGVAVTSLNKQEKKQVKKIARKQARKQVKKVPAGPEGPAGPKGDQGVRGPTGPTEGTSTPPTNKTRQVFLDEDDFETTRAGRLFVVKQISNMLLDCDSGSTYEAWLEVDSVPVPGGFISGLPDNTLKGPLTFAGVTADSLDAGQHTARLAMRCPVGNASSMAIDPNGGVSAVVLGG